MFAEKNRDRRNGREGVDAVCCDVFEHLWKVERRHHIDDMAITKSAEDKVLLAVCEVLSLSEAIYSQ